MYLTEEKLNILRQWFGNIEERDRRNNAWLKSEDYELAKEIHNALGVDVPTSIERRFTDRSLAYVLRSHLNDVPELVLD